MSPGKPAKVHKIDNEETLPAVKKTIRRNIRKDNAGHVDSNGSSKKQLNFMHKRMQLAGKLSKNISHSPTYVFICSPGKCCKSRAMLLKPGLTEPF